MHGGSSKLRMVLTHISAVRGFGELWQMWTRGGMTLFYGLR